MAGYVKIWTAVRADSKFLSLPALSRGIFLQLIVACKSQLDDGYVRYRNRGAMGADLGCDGRTAYTVIAKLHEICLLVLRIDENNGIEVFIPNYMKWQDVTVKDIVTKRRKVTAKLHENCSLLDQTRPDQTNTIAETPSSSKEQESKQDQSDITAFVEIYHQECPSLPRIREITEPRKKRISACLKKCPDLEKWRAFFKHRIHKSDFLAGRKSEWKASLDWILKPANYIKITEGQYDNKTRPTMSAADQYDQEDAVHRRTDKGHEKEQTIGDVISGIAEKYQGVEE